MTMNDNPSRSHQLAIARKTLRMNDVMVRVMGGMTKAEARRLLARSQRKENDNE